MIYSLSPNRSSISEYLRSSNDACLSSSLVSVIDETVFDPTSFSPCNYDEFTLQELHQYLTISHDLFLNHWLPKIDHTVSLLVNKEKQHHLLMRVLKLFLTKYRIELEQHIQEEEKVLFMHIESILNGKHHQEEEKLAINHFLNTHNDNIVLHLDELKKDLLHFNNKFSESLIFQILFHQLNLFQQELTIHGLIEDQVVVPRLLKRRIKT